MNQHNKGDDSKTKYYTRKQIDSINVSESYKELLNVALNVLKSMPKPIVQVCGPISTGGLGSIEKNLEVLGRTIRKLESGDHHVFGQVPFEDKMQELKKEYVDDGKASDALLEEFYLPIFEAGFITEFYFINGWESSYGARWEREMAKKFNIKIIDLPKNFLE